MSFSLFEILLIALALGVDAFSVAISVGIYSCLPVQIIRISLSFGFFQFIMPVIGWYMGNSVIAIIGKYSGWVAFGLLLAVGVHMLIEAFDRKQEKINCDRTVGWTLLGLSIATSIDALGVGFSMGAVQAPLWLAAIIIGIVACLMTVTGMYFGKKLSETFGKSMEIVAGIVLILLSFKMLGGIF